MDWAIVILVVATACWVVVEVLALMGLFGAVSHERLERCVHCGHFGLTTHGMMHPRGCPSHSAADLPHRIHLHH